MSNRFQKWVDSYGVRALSLRLGVTYEAIRKWKNGERFPGPQYWRPIVKASKGKITLDHLLEIFLSGKAGADA